MSCHSCKGSISRLPQPHKHRATIAMAAVASGCTRNTPLKLISAGGLARLRGHPARTRLRIPILVGSRRRPASWGYIDPAPYAAAVVSVPVGLWVLLTLLNWRISVFFVCQGFI